MKLTPLESILQLYIEVLIADMLVHFCTFSFQIPNSRDCLKLTSAERRLVPLLDCKLTSISANHELGIWNGVRY
jgi:hypothetical protein